GIAKTKDGIWFHDSNFCCAYFPAHPSEQKMEENFKKFITEHHNKFYKNLNVVFFVPVEKKSPPTQEKTLAHALQWSYDLTSAREQPAEKKNEKIDTAQTTPLKMKK